MKGLKIRRFIICFSMVLVASILFLIGGALAMDGENPIKLGVSIWYLNDTDRNVLRVAGDNRYLTYAENIEENVKAYLPRLDNVNRGDWKLVEKEAQDGRLLFEDLNNGNQVEILYHPFLSGYVLFEYQIFQP